MEEHCMIKKTIEEIAKMIEIKNDVVSFHQVEVSGVCIDTRKVEAGNLFIPLEGEHVDGHQFVEDAFKRGASAAFWHKSVPNPPLHLPILIVDHPLAALQNLAKAYRQELTAKVIGITGSNGKTTTKDMAAAILSETFIVQKTEGNYNNHIGLPLTILSLNKEVEVAVLELGMSAKGEIALLTDIARPDIAIITNIGEAHLLDLGSRSAIAAAKMEITAGMKKDGILLYPGDEPLLIDMLKEVQGRKRSFGKTIESDVYPINAKQHTDGHTFSINIAEDEVYTVPVLGFHNVLNALPAILAAKSLGMEYKAIKKGLQALTLSKNRMEWVKGKKGIQILDDSYNASPTAMRAVLQLFENIGEDKKRIVVLGDMLELGEEEISFHQQIGRELHPDHLQYVFTYGQLSQYIAEEARKNFPDDRVFAFLDKKLLMRTLEEKLEGDELVLVKASRGMKLEEVVAFLACT